MKNDCLRKIFLFFLLCQTLSAVAQNNPFKIDDHLYGYLSKCLSVIKQKKVLTMSDTLFMMAQKRKDVKAQCLALNLKGEYYYYNEDIKNLKIEKKRIGMFAIRTPYKQYVFSIWNRLIAFYLNRDLPDLALAEAREYQKKAIALDNSYGIGTSYRKLGDIYFILQQNDLALQQYQKCVDIYKNNNLSNELFNVYTAMATVYKVQGKFEMAEQYYLMSLKEARIETSRGGIYLDLCQLYLEEKRMDQVDKYIALLQQWEQKNGKTMSFIERERLFYTNYYISKHDFAQALKISNEMTSISKYEMKINIYKQQNDYKKAYECLNSYVTALMNDNNKRLQKSLATYTAQFDNERIENEKNKLLLQNAILKLIQMNSHEQLMTAEHERNGLKLRNTQLELHNRNLELKNNRLALLRQQDMVAKQKSDIRHEHEMLLNSEQRAKANKRLALAMIAIVILVMLAFMKYVLMRRKAACRIEKEMEKVKKARDEAEIARNEAVKANNVKTIFMQNMSHEIRTPLNAIVGFSEMMNDPNMDISMEERKKFTELIRMNSESLTNMVADILDTATLDTGTYKVSLQEVSLNKLCQQTIASLSCNVSPDVSVEFKESPTDFILKTDALRVKQLLTNLLTNACKYTMQGSIVLMYDVLPHQVLFSITDTGCGIAAENSERIFQRFEKLDNFKPGTGLGLNICRQIAQLFGGEVKLDTSYKSGARFVFVHPY